MPSQLNIYCRINAVVTKQCLGQGREPMAREPDVALLMTASGSLDIFFTIVKNETFSVIFHPPDYKAISNTMQHQKSY